MKNPFMDLSPAEIDVLDDMLEEWKDKDRHGELKRDLGYGPKKTAAFFRLITIIGDVWNFKVNYQDVEEMDG